MQAGDVVIIDGVIRTVSRTTRTQIMIAVTSQYEKKYRRSDGKYITSNQWTYKFIRQPTAERRARADMLRRDRAAMAVINKTRFADLPVEKLERIAAIIQEGN